jgi:gamma-secretase subunit APH-1
MASFVILWGCLFLAYGPSVALLLTFISKRSALLVLSVFSAFVWLLSILLTSLFWLVAPPALQRAHLYAIVISVIIQELMRYALLYLYTRVIDVAEAMDRKKRDRILARVLSGKLVRKPKREAQLSNDFDAAIGAGVGYGLMHTVMMYGGVISASSDLQGWYRSQCPALNAFAASAATALLYNILHIPLMIIALDAFRRWNWKQASVPLLLHLAFAIASTLQEGSLGEVGCNWTFPALVLISIAAVGIALTLASCIDYAAALQIKMAHEEISNFFDQFERMNETWTPPVTNAVASSYDNLRQRRSNESNA